MKIFDIFLFCFSILTMFIGIHQAMLHGFPAAYWLFMISLSALLWYQIRKKKQHDNTKEKKDSPHDKNTEKLSKKRKYKI